MHCNVKDSPIAKISELNTSRRKSEITETQISHQLLESKTYYTVWQRLKRKVIINIRLKKLLNLHRMCTVNPNYTILSDNALQNYVNSKLSTNTLTIVSSESKCIIDPDAKFASFWSILINIALLYSAFISPYALSFLDIEINDSFFGVDIMIDIVFIIDLLFNLNLAYYDEEGQKVRNRWLIMKNCFNFWFLLDIIASVPFSIIEYSLNRSNSLLTKLRSLPKLLKLSRVLKLIRSLSKLENIEYLVSISQRTWRFLKVSFQSFLSLHLVACLWHFSAKIEEFSDETWVFRYNYVDLPPGERYQNSLYWALTTLTTIGYGDICPYTPIEKLISVFWMITGVYLISFSVGSLAAATASQGSKSITISNQINSIEKFGKLTKVDKKILYRMKLQIRLSSEKSNLSEKGRESMINGLPMKIKYEVAMDVYNKAVAKFPFFTERNQSFVAEIGLHLKQENFPAGGKIWDVGEASDGIFFIIEGNVSYKLKERNIKFYTLHEGQYFGDIEVVNEEERQFLVKAYANLSVLVLPTIVIEKIKTDFPCIWLDIKKVSKERERLLLINAAEMIVINRVTKSRDLQESPDVLKLLINEEYELLRKPGYIDQEQRLVRLESQVKHLTESIELLKKTVSTVCYHSLT